MRRADQVAQVHGLADAFRPDAEIAAHEFYVAARAARLASLASIVCRFAAQRRAACARSSAASSAASAGSSSPTCPTPEPGPGEVRIRVRAAGLNFADTLMIKGQYQDKPALPFVPGMEVAGRIDACGPGVAGFAPGERVMAALGHGGFAEAAVCPVEDVVRLPDSMDDVDRRRVRDRLRHRLWRALLGWPPAGGRDARGARRRRRRRPRHGRVRPRARRPRDRHRARRGSPRGGAARMAPMAVIDTASEDVRARIKELTDGRGADVVFDPIGGELFQASLRSIAWDGRILVIGFASGQIPQIPANLLLVKNARRDRLLLGQLPAARPGARARGVRGAAALARRGPDPAAGLRGAAARRGAAGAGAPALAPEQRQDRAHASTIGLRRRAMAGRMTVVQGDITRQEVDAIVNAANEALRGGGGVDGAIHRAAGPGAARGMHPKIGGCPTGEARITKGYRLPARYVIHTVGPVWHGGDRGEPEKLAACYRNSLQLAAENGVRTIAFPGISTGVYGYPLEDATRLAMRHGAGLPRGAARDRGGPLRHLRRAGDRGRGARARRAARRLSRRPPRAARFSRAVAARRGAGPARPSSASSAARDCGRLRRPARTLSSGASFGHRLTVEALEARAVQLAGLVEDREGDRADVRVDALEVAQDVEVQRARIDAFAAGRRAAAPDGSRPPGARPRARRPSRRSACARCRRRAT